MDNKDKADEKKDATSAKGVKALIKKGDAGMYLSGNGLYLKISGKGTGSWIYRYQLDGKRRKMGLGSCAGVSLADARAFVAEQAALIARGIDPANNRDQQALEKKKLSVTMADVALDYIDEQSKSWSHNTLVNWSSTNLRYITPAIGHLAPADVTTEHILELLQPIWLDKPAQARQVRSRTEKLLNAAKARKLRDGENVASWHGHLELLLTQSSKAKTNAKRKHHPALPWAQVAEFWRVLQRDENISADALRLIMLTAVRANEAAAAHWSEFDLDAAVWTVPAERMKMKYPHRVPLSSAALDFLETLPRLAGGYLFAGRDENPTIRSQAILDTVNRLHKDKIEIDGKGWIDDKGDKITVHGFRSTFRDWAEDTTNTPDRVIERCIAHATGSQTVKAYLRTDQLDRRRELMEAWGEYVTRPADSNVIQLRKEA